MPEVSRRIFLMGAAAGSAAHRLQGSAQPPKPSFGAPLTAVEAWRRARFGMFIHWGLYSILGRGEWAEFFDQMDYREYERLAERFRAESFDAEAWVAAAKAAGMKYMVLTARHHDGFCLWDSKASNFKSTNSAAKRDFVLDYTRACRKAGMLVGLYYSPLDWRFPGFFFPGMYRESAEAMKKQTYDQVRELLTGYGKIDILWFDGGGDDWLGLGGLEYGSNGWRSRDTKWPQQKHYSGKPLWEPQKLYAMIRELQPEIMMNDRAGSLAAGEWQGDFSTPEGKVGEFNVDRAWETCDKLCTGWGWEPDDAMKSLRTCIQLLVKVAVNDGNLLLNVGPAASGLIEPRQVTRLRDTGAWLSQFGESIYGTRGGPFPSGAWGGCTHRGNRIYVHVIDWIEDYVQLPPIARKIVGSRSLTAREATVRQTPEGVRISVPPEDRQAPDSIVALELDGPV